MGHFKDRLTAMVSRQPASPECASLVRAIAGVMEQDTSQTRRTLYEQLLACSMLVPTERGENRPDMQAELLAFTDTPALRAWAKRACPYVTMSGPEVFQVAKRHGRTAVRINPAGPHSWLVSRDELAVLADGGIPLDRTTQRQQITVNRGTTLHITPLKSPPPAAFIQYLHETLARYPAIGKAYLFRFYGDDGKPQVTLGLTVLSRQQDHAVMAAMIDDIGQRLTPLVGQGQSLSIIPLKDPGLLSAVYAQIPPIYQR